MNYEGNAILYCQDAFGTTNGKTAHGLIRRSERYRILSVIDRTLSGRDAGEYLDGRHRAIPIVSDLKQAVELSRKCDMKPDFLVIGQTPDGGRMPEKTRLDILQAIQAGLNIDSGLHDYLTDDRDIVDLAQNHGVMLRDIRKPPDLKNLHFFSGKINEVTSFKIAVLGTDSAVGKRTTAWFLVDALRNAEVTVEMIGTGQTSWLQGARYSFILDSLINDFLSGEIEHAVWQAWKDQAPDVIILEGQGSLMNPAYPGGYELLAAGRPDAVILQHAPARKEYDGFPGYPIQSIEKQIQAIELISGKPVIAITVNHENLRQEDLPKVCRELTEKTGLLAIDVTFEGMDKLIETILLCMQRS